MQMELPGLDLDPVKKNQPGGVESQPDQKNRPTRSRSKTTGQLVLPGAVLRLAPQAAAQDDRLPRKRVA